MYAPEVMYLTLTNTFQSLKRDIIQLKSLTELWALDTDL